jgi:hypothetical protein
MRVRIPIPLHRQISVNNNITFSFRSAGLHPVLCSLSRVFTAPWLESWHEDSVGECRLLGYKTPVRTSQETHYVSATKSSRLMLRNIWGLHGSGYEECRLLGYKNPVHTSQETHYVSATESSRLMLCRIWSFDGHDYEECRHQGCYAVWFL